MSFLGRCGRKTFPANILQSGATSFIPDFCDFLMENVLSCSFISHSNLMMYSYYGYVLSLFSDMENEAKRFSGIM